MAFSPDGVGGGEVFVGVSLGVIVGEEVTVALAVGVKVEVAVGGGREGVRVGGAGVAVEISTRIVTSAPVTERVGAGAGEFVGPQATSTANKISPTEIRTLLSLI